MSGGQNSGPVFMRSAFQKAFSLVWPLTSSARTKPLSPTPANVRSAPSGTISSAKLS